MKILAALLVSVSLLFATPVLSQEEDTCVTVEDVVTIFGEDGVYVEEVTLLPDESGVVLDFTEEDIPNEDWTVFELSNEGCLTGNYFIAKSDNITAFLKRHTA